MENTKENTVTISCTKENAAKFWDWICNRGGIAHWQSQDLSNPGKSFSTPFFDKDGQPITRPHWSVGEKPNYVETNPEKIIVFSDKEVKRFKIAVRYGASGLTVKLTDASSRKVRAAVEKAGKDAYYVFDYNTQEAVIMVPDSQITLLAWAQAQSIVSQ